MSRRTQKTEAFALLSTSLYRNNRLKNTDSRSTQITLFNTVNALTLWCV